MILLQGYDFCSLFPESGDSFGCRLCCRHCCNVRNLVFNSSFADIRIIRGPALADGRIDYEIDISVFDCINDIGPSLINF